jgi:hypothetical protein
MHNLTSCCRDYGFEIPNRTNLVSPAGYIIFDLQMPAEALLSCMVPDNSLEFFAVSGPSLNQSAAGATQLLHSTQAHLPCHARANTHTAHD